VPGDYTAVHGAVTELIIAFGIGTTFKEAASIILNTTFEFLKQ